MTYESRRLAGILLMVLPTVMFGEVSILSLLVGDPTWLELQSRAYPEYKIYILPRRVGRE